MKHLPINQIQLFLASMFVLSLGMSSCDQPATEEPTKENSSKELDDQENIDDQDGSQESNEGEDNRSHEQRLKDAEEYFASNVRSVIDVEECRACHNAPRFNPPEGAHEGIYDYEWGDKVLTKDDGPLGNKFIRKLQGLDEHGGGNRCGAGIEESPCKEIIEWWMLKHGRTDITGQVSEGASSHKITAYNADGSFYGIAIDGADSDAKLKVRFYINGPSGAGELMPEIDANQSGHKFKFVSLSESYKDGAEHKAHIYSIGVDGEEIEFENSPYSFKAFLPKGKDDYYLTNVPTKMNSCGGGSCHSTGSNGFFRYYEQDYASLSEPAPSEGGSPTNNNLYRTLSGNNHRGGNVLGNGANAGLSDALQEWWRKEFE